MGRGGRWEGGLVVWWRKRNETWEGMGMASSMICYGIQGRQEGTSSCFALRSPLHHGRMRMQGYLLTRRGACPLRCMRVHIGPARESCGVGSNYRPWPAQPTLCHADPRDVSPTMHPIRWPGFSKRSQGSWWGPRGGVARGLGLGGLPSSVAHSTVCHFKVQARPFVPCLRPLCTHPPPLGHHNPKAKRPSTPFLHTAA